MNICNPYLLISAKRSLLIPFAKSECESGGTRPSWNVIFKTPAKSTKLRSLLLRDMSYPVGVGEGEGGGMGALPGEYGGGDGGGDNGGGLGGGGLGGGRGA